MQTSVEAEPVSGLERISLTALAWIFIRIACVSFGGFMVMISAVQHAVVERRKLMMDHDVLDGISLASVLPGPIAVNVVAYVGYRLHGISGALVSVIAAMFPAFLLMTLLSNVYFRWGHTPEMGKIFMGLVPLVTAIILAAAWRMWKKSVTVWREGLLSVSAATILLAIGGIYAMLIVILFAALAGVGWFSAPHPVNTDPFSYRTIWEKSLYLKRRILAGVRHAKPLLLLGAPGLAIPLLNLDAGILFKLFFTFASMSILLFGGGYVFIPLLQQIVVDSYGWVTQQEFVDAVAMSQVMPGPVVVSATFIGFKVAGIAGAMAATIGIFLPSSMLMVLCASILDRIKNSSKVEAALRGVRAAVVGMVFAAAILVGKTATPNWLSLTLFLASFVVLLRYRIDAIWLVPPAGLIGFYMY